MFKSLTEKVHSLLALVAKPKDQLSRVEHLQKIQNEIKTVTQSGTPFLKKELRDCLDEAQDKYKKAAASMRHFCQLFKTEFTKSCPSITLQDNETPENHTIKEITFASDGKITISTNHPKDVRALMEILNSVWSAALTANKSFTCDDLTTHNPPKNEIVIGGSSDVKFIVIDEFIKGKFMSSNLAKDIKEFLSKEFLLLAKKEEANVQPLSARRDSNKENEEVTAAATEGSKLLQEESATARRLVLAH